MTENLRDRQLADIRRQIKRHENDAADLRREATAALVAAENCDEMGRRWEVVHDAIRFGVVPNLDGCLGPDTGEVPW